MSEAAEASRLLRDHANPEKAAFFPRFFKTQPGQYGEGDMFLGVTVPDCRAIAKKHQTMPLADVARLLESKWHEDRLVALLILVIQYQKADESGQETSYSFYLDHTVRINNWDLVDLSCRDIVGHFTFHHPKAQPTLNQLAKSPLLWDRRIAIISTFYFLQHGDPAPTLRIAEQLLSDKHDLIQKAVGWMLRELGKRIDENILLDFLQTHYTRIPRTTLRYAVERFSLSTRKDLLRGVFRR
jgi:3-methyladenine DNA glycosylase AlkD